MIFSNLKYSLCRFVCFSWSLSWWSFLLLFDSCCWNGFFLGNCIHYKWLFSDYLYNLQPIHYFKFPHFIQNLGHFRFHMCQNVHCSRSYLLLCIGCGKHLKRPFASSPPYSCFLSPSFFENTQDHHFHDLHQVIFWNFCHSYALLKEHLCNLNLDLLAKRDRFKTAPNLNLLTSSFCLKIL